MTSRGEAWEWSAASDEDAPPDRGPVRRRRRRSPAAAVLARLARRSRGYSFVRLSDHAR